MVEVCTGGELSSVGHLTLVFLMMGCIGLAAALAVHRMMVRSLDEVANARGRLLAAAYGDMHRYRDDTDRLRRRYLEVCHEMKCKDPSWVAPDEEVS